MVWVMVISIGFYGVKGGIFTLLTGGAYHVYGPARSFIGGNNEIGLALIMTIPLMRYLQLSAETKLQRYGAIASIGLTFVAILGTQSRGAFLGLIAMVTYLIMKSRKRGALLGILLLFLPFAFLFMPDAWYDRMMSIGEYDQDESAQGRIRAWTMAWRTAVDYPIFGGGFNVFGSWAWAVYAPPGKWHDVHSVYFEILGEHGFVGLGLFLLLGLMGLNLARRIVRETKNEPRLFWMRDLASMIHVSLIGYAVSGTFLGLAYFDFYYTLLAVLVGLNALLTKYQAEGIPETERVRDTSAFGRGTPLRPPDGVAPGPAMGRKKSPLVAFQEWYGKL
jgi:probable O-glycosylation ligase (exosortase A-associated)